MTTSRIFEPENHDVRAFGADLHSKHTNALAFNQQSQHELHEEQVDTRVPTGDALDVAEATFDMLMAGPAPLTIDGAAIGHGLPQHQIGLVELRSVLLHPATGRHARDAVWQKLIRAARQDGPDWAIGCIGVSLPGLKAITAHVRATRRGLDGDALDELAAALVVGFYDGLRTIDIDVAGRASIAQRLLWRARKAALRTLAADPHTEPIDPQLLRDTLTSRPAEQPDLLLATAVKRGVISQLDAAVIAVTRLENLDTHQLADQLGMTWCALMKRRRRAELALAEALRDGGLREELGDLMSRPGL